MHAEDLVTMVKGHRLYSHPIWSHWAEVSPSPVVLGALFHQIQCFCASTRPALAFPEGLRRLGLDRPAELIDEIVASEAGHGPELATMAGHIINRAAGRPVCDDLNDQARVEKHLKEASDRVLGELPGYDRKTGLTVQARNAISVFERRNSRDGEMVLRNLGTALGLEIISNQELIPGEKQALVDSGIYGVSLDDAEMHYLKEHWGECGAEQQHERNVVNAVSYALTRETEAAIVEGVNDFQESLARLWDLLDSALLQSGYAHAA